MSSRVLIPDAPPWRHNRTIPRAATECFIDASLYPIAPLVRLARPVRPVRLVRFGCFGCFVRFRNEDHQASCHQGLRSLLLVKSQRFHGCMLAPSARPSGDRNALRAVTCLSKATRWIPEARRSFCDRRRHEFAKLGRLPADQIQKLAALQL
ncbi:hypothetical protein E4U42_003929 [Claviceps africana]|uniref:Uncharacterized protein n=1 Tax=Claviceps africana TaxID=83212 RepID=A0A8K0NIK9_9HYPO|nr:hypothetical protein E4U42_003929 [Claviceps africana]